MLTGLIEKHGEEIVVGYETVPHVRKDNTEGGCGIRLRSNRTRLRSNRTRLRSNRTRLRGDHWPESVHNIRHGLPPKGLYIGTNGTPSAKNLLASRIFRLEPAAPLLQIGQQFLEGVGTL